MICSLTLLKKGLQITRQYMMKPAGWMTFLILDINPAGAALAGVKREEQIGKTWKEVMDRNREITFLISTEKLI